MYVISGVLLKRPGMSQGLMMSSITLMLLTHTSQIPPPSKVQRRGGEARVYIEWLALVTPSIPDTYILVQTIKPKGHFEIN